MLNKLFSYTILTCLLSQVLSLSTEEKSALFDLKRALHIQKMDAPNIISPCKWKGIRCEKDRDGNSHVTELILGFRGLTGEIPESLSDMIYLEVIQLQNNSISGKIPSSIGKLTKLRILNLQMNELEDKIPNSISNCKKLKKFSVGSNRLTGKIPEALNSLENLEELDLSDNQFVGPVSPDLLQLPKLEVLEIDHNYLSGTLPDHKLKVFRYIKNNFTMEDEFFDAISEQ